MVFEAVAPFRGVKVRADVELDDGRIDEVRRAIASRYLGDEAGEAFVAGGVPVWWCASPCRRPTCGTSPASSGSLPSRQRGEGLSQQDRAHEQGAHRVRPPQGVDRRERGTQER